MEIRRLRGDEVEAWREIRLRALADSPAAFATTYEEATAWDDDTWARRVATLGEGEQSVMFVADRGGQLAGVAGAHIDPDDPDMPQLISMWVAPDARGMGTGRGLIEAVVAWARERGYSSIRLFVTSGNTAAETAYRKCGFVRTGHAIPLPRDPEVSEEEMVRVLDTESR